MDKERLEELLKQAQEDELHIRKRIAGLPVSISDLNMLIEAGAGIIRRNEESCDNCYIHRVNYKGYNFKTITETKL